MMESQIGPVSSRRWPPSTRVFPIPAEAVSRTPAERARPANTAGEPAAPLSRAAPIALAPSKPSVASRPSQYRSWRAPRFQGFSQLMSPLHFLAVSSGEMLAPPMGFDFLQGPRFLVVACGLQEASRLPASWLSFLPRFAFVMAIHDGACRAHPSVCSSAQDSRRSDLPLLRATTGSCHMPFQHSAGVQRVPRCAHRRSGNNQLGKAFEVCPSLRFVQRVSHDALIA
jgi:hypothetical protein